MREAVPTPRPRTGCGTVLASNLYVHFPFCRRKCTYCALYSRCGVSESDRADYVAALARTVRVLTDRRGKGPPLATVYFGGGSPALCDLRPLLEALAPSLTSETEFTVELHPLDVTDETLSMLKAGGVNRISMGVQSLDDATLTAMGRGYAAADAARAFARVRRQFDNAGIDLIVGFPGDPCADYGQLADWGLQHCSAYSLQLEEGTLLALQERQGKVEVPSDDWTLDRLRTVAATLESMGLRRYEISNYARPGRECRHNLATWRGEDYLGLGDGASGRLGRFRTRNWWGQSPFEGGQTPFGRGQSPEVEEVSEKADALERRIFALRTREGLDAGDRPRWWPVLDRGVDEGLLMRDGRRYVLTPRGTEVCDAILADLIDA